MLYMVKNFLKMNEYDEGRAGLWSCNLFLRQKVIVLSSPVNLGLS